MSEGNYTLVEIEVDDPLLLLALTNPAASHLVDIAKEFSVEVGVRGQIVRLRGSRWRVERAERALIELVDALRHKGSSDVLGRYERDDVDGRQGENHSQHSIETTKQQIMIVTPRKTVIARGASQCRYIQSILKKDVVFGVGPAGTGKTYLAVAMAVRFLMEKRIKRVVLTRPVVEAGEKLGFLPGGIFEKVNPYLRPLYDALHEMMEAERIVPLIERGIIEVAPLAFMRGRTLNDSFVIFDEAQNSTIEQMKMFLTRIGFGTKFVITGDTTQVDLTPPDSSGLADALEILKNVDSIEIVHFSDSDVVRHPLVGQIIRAYERKEKRAAG
ncbi:MAG: PhoH family protein [Sandaracinaceae bacterium]|nr:PhoH family protein [Sandaracinaceae bacterium]